MPSGTWRNQAAAPTPTTIASRMPVLTMTSSMRHPLRGAVDRGDVVGGRGRRVEADALLRLRASGSLRAKTGLLDSMRAMWVRSPLLGPRAGPCAQYNVRVPARCARRRAAVAVAARAPGGSRTHTGRAFKALASASWATGAARATVRRRRGPADGGECVPRLVMRSHCDHIRHTARVVPPRPYGVTLPRGARACASSAALLGRRRAEHRRRPGRPHRRRPARPRALRLGLRRVRDVRLLLPHLAASAGRCCRRCRTATRGAASWSSATSLRAGLVALLAVPGAAAVGASSPC